MATTRIKNGYERAPIAVLLTSYLTDLSGQQAHLYKERPLMDARTAFDKTVEKPKYTMSIIVQDSVKWSRRSLGLGKFDTMCWC